MPIVLLATFFGPSASGQYALAISILGVPSNLVATAVMTVLYPTVTATIQSGNKASRLLLKSTLWMAIAGTVPFLFIAFFGKAFFTFVFGAGWAAAGSYAQLLSVWLFFQFINKPVVSAVPALKLERGLLLYECASSASKALALAAGFYLFKSDIVAIGMFSASGVAAYLFLIVWILRRAR
jgi:O-antigen/teichoic acid export membrane protein